METMDFPELDLELNATYILHEEDHDGRDSVQVTQEVVVGIFTTLGILTSLLLMSCPVFIRALRTPFFIVLFSWSLANIINLILKAVITFTSQGEWTLGSLGCHASVYINSALVFTRPYLLTLAGLMTLLGNRRCQGWTESRPWLRIVAPYLASTVVWLMTFLPCIWYWFQTEHTSYVGPYGDQYICSFQPENRRAQILTEFFLSYFLPSTLISTLLLAWACLRWRKIDPVENVQAIILFTLLHVYLATMLLQFAVNLVDPSAVTVWLYLIAYYVAMSDLAISPALCLIIIGLCRRSLRPADDIKRHVGSGERDAETRMELVQ